MRAIALIALVALAGCRPLDASAPVEDSAEASPRFGGDPVPLAVRNGTAQIGQLRIIDGDTFEMQGEVIRIANIDAPERAPRARCPSEAALAEVATNELNAILGASWAGPSGSAILPTIERQGQDRYRRTLARVRAVSGEDVGEALIARNVAVRWTGRRAEWCG